MFLYSQWARLPLVTRVKLASAFGIVKRGPTEVDSNQIKSDGYLLHEIETAMTKEAMEKYVGMDEKDSATLWLLVVAKAEGRREDVIQPPVITPKVEAVKPAVKKVEVKKPGKTKK